MWQYMSKQSITRTSHRISSKANLAVALVKPRYSRSVALSGADNRKSAGPGFGGVVEQPANQVAASVSAARMTRCLMLVNRNRDKRLRAGGAGSITPPAEVN